MVEVIGLEEYGINSTDLSISKSVAMKSWSGEAFKHNEILLKGLSSVTYHLHPNRYDMSAYGTLRTICGK